MRLGGEQLATLLAGLLGVPGTASARAPYGLVVERAPGAEDCDDEPALRRKVARIVGSARLRALAGERSLAVVFMRTDDGHLAARLSIEGADGGRRELGDAGPSCEALSQAVGVAIAVVLDGASTQSLPETASAQRDGAKNGTATPVSPSASTSDAAPRERAASAGELRAGFELGAAQGLSSGASLHLGGWLGVQSGALVVDLGGNLDLAPAARDFGGGRVRASLWYGTLRGCWLFGRSWAAGPCGQLGLGVLRGHGEGYTEARAAALAWSALSAGLLAQAPLGRESRLFLSAGVWVPTRRLTWSVENVGIAWKSPAVAVALAAGFAISGF